MEDYKVLNFTIVLVGEIPVRLFTPDWLAKHKLIKEEEAEVSEIKLFTPQIVRFDIADWGTVEATDKRLVISTVSEAHHETLRDIIQSILTVLEGNYITNLGINHVYSFEVNLNTYTHIGDFLAPFKNWENIFEDPKMLNLEMVQETRDDGYDGRYRIRINPTDQFKGYGFSFNVNSHFNVQSDPKETASETSEILKNKYDDSHVEALSFVTKFWENFGDYEK